MVSFNQRGHLVNFDAQIEMEIWDGPLSKRERCPNATAVALREALSRLDGRRVDSVWIEVADVGALCVGGGPSEFVVVSFHADGSSSHVVSGDDDGNTVELQVGGQTGVYPCAMVLTAAAAFDIAERFRMSGTYDPSRRWIKDCPAE